MSKLKLTCGVVGIIMLLTVTIFQLSKPTSPLEEWESVNSKMANTLHIDPITDTSKEAPKEAPEEIPKEAPKEAPEEAPPQLEFHEDAPKSVVTHSSPQSDPININLATLEQLDVLPGIGPSKAKAIVDYRTKYGDFQTLEQLMEVKGIGPKIFAKMKEKITIQSHS